MRRKHRAICSLSVALLTAATAAAPSQDAKRSFGDVIEVQLVNVEVWVTDGKGHPVTGLVVEDFEVREDGESVPITHFTEVRAKTHKAAVPAPGTTREVTSLDQAGEASVADAVAPAHLILYFDQLHLTHAGRKQLVGDLREFLQSAPVPPQQVLILRQGQKLSLEAGLGSTTQELEAALSRLNEASASGTQTAQEKRLAIQRLQQLWETIRLDSPTRTPCEEFPKRAVPEIELFAMESLRRISVTLNHVAETVRFLAGVPGVKTLLYVSDGLETTPGTDLLSFVDDVCPGQAETSEFDLPEGLSEPLRRLTRHANANRVTIYSLQPRGLRSSVLTLADQGFVEPRASRGLDMAIRSSERDGLSYLARQTGGRAVFNRNRFADELETIGDEMRNYYSLAYVPPHGGDGGEHRIEVRLRQPGLQLRHRRGYRDKSADVRMAERLQSTLYLGQVANPLAVRLGAGEVRESGKRSYALPLHVMVPVEQVVFLPQAASPLAELTVQVAGRNDRGRRMASQETRFRVRRPAEAENRLLDLIVEVEITEGVNLLAVAVRDETTGETSYVSTTLGIRPPEPAAGEG